MTFHPDENAIPLHKQSSSPS